MSTTEASPLRVLVVGESWIKHTIHMKGFDQFHSTEYEEGAGVFLDAVVMGQQRDRQDVRERGHAVPRLAVDTGEGQVTADHHQPATAADEVGEQLQPVR
jgi:hypothetical protein